MRFLHPSLFYLWALLALVPILLYLFRPRPRTVRTSTLPFFKWLAREHQDSAWLKWLKHLLSLLLSILAMLGAAAVLGRLVVAPPAESLKTVVLLVDRSASMSAGQSQGGTSLDRAVRLARHRLAGLPEGTGVIVMAYDRRPEVLLSRSLDRRQVERALASVSIRPIEGDPQAALRLAGELASLETPAAVWHVTDRPPSAGDKEVAGEQSATGEEVRREEEVEEEPGVAIETICAAPGQPVNVGITAFRLRRLPLQQAGFEAFVQVHAAAPAPVEAELAMRLDGALVRIRNLKLEPGGRQKLLIPIEAGPESERVLWLRVTAPGDVLPVDDVVCARIPRVRPVRVLWIAEKPDPFTELALSSLGSQGDLEVLQGGPAAWPPKEPVDVAIFDSWLPPKWPAEWPVIVVNPPGSLGPLRAVEVRGGGLTLDTLRATNDRHPLLYGVATERIALTQTAMVEASGPLESIWVGPQGPLLMAGDDRGQRMVVMAFSPPQSERLPLMASYPLLLGNAVYWVAAHRLEDAQGMNMRAGDLIGSDAQSIAWQASDAADAPRQTDALEGHTVELDRVGLWELDDGLRGSASLLSASETLLSLEEAPPTAAGEEVPAAWAGAFRGDLTSALLWGVLTLLIVESWLFHRYLTY